MGALRVGRQRTASLALPPAVRESSSMRTVNTTMRELSRSFPGSEPIAFFCECHSPSCFSAVWVSPDVFDATVAGHRDWMLLEGHRPSGRWRAGAPGPSPATRTRLRVLPDLDDGAPRPPREQPELQLRRPPREAAMTGAPDRAATPDLPGLMEMDAAGLCGGLEGTERGMETTDPQAPTWESRRRHRDRWLADPSGETAAPALRTDVSPPGRSLREERGQCGCAKP
jgi:hypothetical protein